MRFILLLLILPSSTYAQKWVDTDSEKHPIENKIAALIQTELMVELDTASIKSFLKNRLPNLKGQNVNLMLENQIASRKGVHYRFSQTINDRKVYRGSVKLNVDNDGRLLSLFDHTFEVPNFLDSEFPNHQPYHDGLMVHYETPNNGRLHNYTLSEVYFPEENELVPAIHLEVVETTNRYYELVLNKEVRVIYQNDLLSYSAPQDSIITMWVFNPDPLSSANQTYGVPYSDAFDMDVLELNAEREMVQAPVTFENDTFFLRNDYVAIKEFSLPSIEPAYSLTSVFNFTRAEPGFEDVNAFYHITAFQAHIQTLGFSNIVDYPIEVDVHALNGSDNSNFNPGFNPPRLQFGEGGVDDAEDADVIIHEYGHAVMHAAAPGTNNGTERKALDEAAGDYFASSYSRHISNNRWEDVFTWDGHNEFWPGRSSVSSDHYPEDVDNNIYSDADIWSATLMEIWGDIGRDATDAIMIQAAYSFSEGMTMPQAALLFLQADTLLFGGTNFTPIRQRMYDRGLIPWNVGIEDQEYIAKPFRVYNSAGFTAGTGPMQVVSNQEFRANLFNSVGQLISSSGSDSNQFMLKSDGLSSGVYVLKIELEGISGAVKLVKN
ncbi:hypothetical protein OAL15_03660 [Flavobacteriales bacterium]|nr:hypothetical protein [Flavobacteriales bacterium]